MSGKLLEAARKDMAKIVQSGGFEEDITFSDPSSGLSAIIKGLHSKHWLSFDTDGNAFNSKNAIYRDWDMIIPKEYIYTALYGQN